ncbi:MAG TPA: AraC family ligand binding domain-containing protein [Phenylobacterium sp.]|jgi:mannose-6-phosphate isomerase-like protein (cupin superfamily)|nr:AraC family ligand binding domain-containing protein [Phenylobacterium sp.]
MISLPSRTGLLLAATAVAALGTGARAADQAHRVTGVEITAMVATLKDGLATAPLPTGPGAVVLAARRDRDGEVEVHEHLSDELVVRSGHAVFRVGGTVAGNRQTAPGEWRGGAMTGGDLYRLGPGDVLWIPAGMPHQALVDKGGAFSYLAIKFEAKP